MAKKSIIAVMGATGAQGGGLVRAVLNDPDSRFSVRAITRNTSSPAAAELAKAGAEVVAADADDPESLKRAFDGAYGAYCVTFFWDHFSPDKELAHASAMARAARDAAVHHTIWSTLEDTRKLVPLSDSRMPTLMGKYKVPHFDAKGQADHYFRDAGVPTTFLLTCFYWDNFLQPGMAPHPGADGVLEIVLPMGNKKLPGIAAQDIGGCAYGIFKGGDQWISKTVGISGGHLSGEEMAGHLATALGREVRYREVSPDAYRALGFPGAEDLGNMFQFKRDFESAYREVRNPEIARKLHPHLQDFPTWLSGNGSRIPLAQGAGGA